MGDDTPFSTRYGPWSVVTGAASGVGLAFAEELLSRGVGVVLVDVDPEVERVARSLPGDTRACEVDIASPRWTDRLDEVCRDLDVGLAVANAGVSHVGRFLDMPPARRRTIIDVNCGGTADLAAWAVPRLVERTRGGFVATSSGSALAGTAGVALYSATKAFAVNLVEALGEELRGTGVDTLAIVAPTMDTPGFGANGADPTRLPMPPVPPRGVVARALDALPEGGRWLADESLAFVAEVERRERVRLLGEATMAMYPDRFRADPDAGTGRPPPGEEDGV